MKDECKQEIEKIKSEMECPKHFSCLEDGVDNLCKAKDIGIDDFLECHEDKPFACLFAVPFGNGYFCKCPLAKEFKE